MDERIRIGLVGAGPWARTVHAPGIAEHPGTTLAAVWARGQEAATALAEPHDAVACPDFAELLTRVDAVAFAVPPSIQAELAPEAARAGKHVILEKPVAPDAEAAQRIADAVRDAGVASLVMLTLRYATETREWLAGLASAGGWRGGDVRWLSGALLGDTYGNSSWRHEDGALADIGPHAFDLLDAALGPIERVLSAHVDEADLWRVMLAHEGGLTSSVSLSLRLPVRPTVVDIAVYGEHGYRSLGRKPGAANASYTALLDDFAAMIHSGVTEHPCDVRRGVHLQRVLDEARALATAAGRRG